jgi:pyruvate,water dikinase
MHTNLSWFGDMARLISNKLVAERFPGSDGVQPHRAGVRVPDGFATTADPYRRFLGATGSQNHCQATIGAGRRRRPTACAIGVRWWSPNPFPEDLEEGIWTAHAALAQDIYLSLPSGRAPRPSRPRGRRRIGSC